MFSIVNRPGDYILVTDERREGKRDREKEREREKERKFDKETGTERQRRRN